MVFPEWYSQVPKNKVAFVPLFKQSLSSLYGDWQTRKKQVAQGQYVVSDTRCPALHDFELEWEEAGQRPQRGRCPVEHRGIYAELDLRAPLHHEITWKIDMYRDIQPDRRTENTNKQWVIKAERQTGYLRQSVKPREMKQRKMAILTSEGELV